MGQLPPLPKETDLTKGFAPPQSAARISQVPVAPEPGLPSFTPPAAPSPVTQGVAVALSALAGVPGGQELLGATIQKTMDDYRQRRQMFEADTRRMLEVRWRARMDERMNAQNLNVDIAKANQDAQQQDVANAENARHAFAMEHLDYLKAQEEHILNQARLGLMSQQEAESRLQELKIKAETVQTWAQSFREAAGVARKKSEVPGGAGGEGGGGGGDASMGKAGYEIPETSAEGVQMKARAYEVQALDSQKADLVRQRDELALKDPNAPELAGIQQQIDGLQSQIDDKTKEQRSLVRSYYTRTLQDANVAMAYANGNMPGPDGQWIKIETVDDFVSTVPDDLQPSVRSLIMMMPEVDNRDPKKTQEFMSAMRAFAASAPEPVQYALEKNLKRFTVEAYKQIYIKDGLGPDEAAAAAEEAWSRGELEGLDPEDMPDIDRVQEYLQSKEWAAARDSTAAMLNAPAAQPTAAAAQPETPKDERKAGGIAAVAGPVARAGAKVATSATKGLVNASADLVADTASVTGYIAAGTKGIPDFALRNLYRRAKKDLASFAAADTTKMAPMARSKYEEARKAVLKIEAEAKKRNLSLEGVKP